MWGRVAKAGPARSGRTGFIQLETADGPPVRLRAKNEKYVTEKGLSEFVLGFQCTLGTVPSRQSPIRSANVGHRVVDAVDMERLVYRVSIMVELKL